MISINNKKELEKAQNAYYGKDYRAVKSNSNVGFLQIIALILIILIVAVLSSCSNPKSVEKTKSTEYSIAKDTVLQAADYERFVNKVHEANGICGEYQRTTSSCKGGFDTLYIRDYHNYDAGSQAFPDSIIAMKKVWNPCKVKTDLVVAFYRLPIN